MPATLDACENLFGTRDIYKLLNISKDALDKDIKKAYYKMSLLVHPDRVPEDQKELATEKFKILGKIHLVLTDKDKKDIYDKKGIIDDDDDDSLISVLEMWKQIFKPISNKDIENYKNSYRGSELEKIDIKKAYLNGKGCINYMMNSVPFMNVEDEPRISNIINEMISSDEVPEFKIFTNEPKAKKDRRHKKYARESKEAAKLIEKLNEKEDFEQQMIKRQSDRAAAGESFLNKLLEKYGGDDEDFFLKTNKTKKDIKTKGHTNNKKKNHVKTGRVTRHSKK